MTIDVKQSFRAGKVIVELHIDGEEEINGVPVPIIRRVPTVYKSINQAKVANRKTMYRVVRS